MTRRFLRSLALTALLAGIPVAALAQTPPSPAAISMARELMLVTQTTDQFNQILPAIMRQIQQAATSSNLMLAEKKAAQDLAEISKAVEAEMAPERNQLLDEIARLYAKRFTEAEMKAIIEFFKSPTGAKFVVSAPDMIRDASKIAEGWGQKVGPKANTRVREEMKKRGHPL